MRKPLLALALFTLAACGGSDSGTGPGASPAGTYTLTSADNKPLPAVYADSSLKSGKLVITDAGWSQLTVVQYVAGGSANGDTLTLAGAWATSGSDITLWDGGLNTQYTGTFSSTGIILNTKTGTVLNYSK